MADHGSLQGFFSGESQRGGVNLPMPNCLHINVKMSSEFCQTNYDNSVSLQFYDKMQLKFLIINTNCF